MRSINLFLLFGFITITPLYAIQDSLNVQVDDSKIEIQTISEEDLTPYLNDKDFNYSIESHKESIIDKFFTWLSNILRDFFEAIFGIGQVDGLLYFIFNIVPYILLAILIFLLIRFFLKVNAQNIIAKSNQSASVLITEEEQIIKNEDINALIEAAIKQKNFRLAIRYYYLRTLKYLTEKELIIWEQQKTNNDYILEIKTDHLRKSFEQLTYIYDYVWYGEFDIDEIKFHSFSSNFKDVNKEIG